MTITIKSLSFNNVWKNILKALKEMLVYSLIHAADF